MRRYFSIIATASFCLFLSFQTQGQETWNLEKCIRYAQENSLILEQATFGVEFAEINKKQATQSRYPNLSGNSGLQLNFGRSIDPTSNEFITDQFLSNNFSVSSGVMLFNAGNINNSIKQSKIDLSAAHEDVKQAQNDIALTVANSFLTILLAQEELENVQYQNELAQKQLDQVDKFIRAGSRPQNDRLDFVAQLATSEQSIILAENNLAMAFLNLKQQLRLDPSFNLQLERPSLDIPIESDPDLASFSIVYNEAIKTRPNIRAGEFRLQSAQLNKRITESSLYPRITLSGSLGTNYSNKGLRFTGEKENVFSETEVFVNDVPVTIGQEFEIDLVEKSPYTSQLDENISYGFGINVSIPIYNNYSNKAAIERSKVNIYSVRNNNDQLKDNLKTTIQSVIAEARTAKKAFEVSNRSLEAQEAAFNNTEKKFNLGASSSFEYINAKNQLESAKINQLVSKYDYLFKLKVLDYYSGKPIKLD
jgi:outer membrane protein